MSIHAMPPAAHNDLQFEITPVICSAGLPQKGKDYYRIGSTLEPEKRDELRMGISGPPRGPREAFDPSQYYCCRQSWSAEETNGAPVGRAQQ